MNQTAALILNWNQPFLTILTVESLLLSTQVPDIHLLDNGSTDNSLSLLRHYFADYPNVFIHHSPTNLGYGGGHNFLRRQIQNQPYQFYLIVNNDVIFSPSCYPFLLDHLSTHQHLIATSPKIFFAPGYEYQSNYPSSQLGHIIWAYGGQFDFANYYGSNHGIDQPDNPAFNQTYQPDFISGCCLLIRTQGLGDYIFDPRYCLYLEDVELSFRLRRQGHRFDVFPSAHIWHLNSASTGGRPNHYHDYYLIRNRLLLASSYAPLRTRLAVYRDALRLLFSGTKWQKFGALDYFLGRFGYKTIT